ncbi:MAG: LysM peptidoglycan-binding domain-containing protein [Streptosporangiaceae bacterium]
MMRPKLVAAVLAGGIVVLGAGSAVAASLPSWTTHHSGTVAAAPSTSGPAAVSASPSPSASVSPGSAPSAAGSSARTVKPRHARSITYTVKRGDTLSGIAEWFRLHGYGALYAANQAVIGSNPNLIIPGERITIAHGVMKLSRAR